MSPATNDILIMHSSDLHIDDGYTMRAWGGDGNRPLEVVIQTAKFQAADILLLTGDVFEHNRLKPNILNRTRSLLENAQVRIVMLPGNHDPLTPNSVWRRAELEKIENVHVLGLNENLAEFPEFDLHIWGRPHSDYTDMAPLKGAPARAALYHIVAAHGHYVDRRPPDDQQRASWLITAEEIKAAQGDYVALGHWNVQTKVGLPGAHAHYSGAPDYAGTVNLVRLSTVSEPTVKQVPVLGLPTT